MTKEKPGFMFYWETADALQVLTVEEQAEALKAMVAYSRYGEVPEFHSPQLNVFWYLIKSKLDADQRKWEKKRQQAVDASNKRWKAKEDMQTDAVACETMRNMPSTSTSTSTSASTYTPTPSTTPASLDGYDGITKGYTGCFSRFYESTVGGEVSPDTKEKWASEIHQLINGEDSYFFSVNPFDTVLRHISENEQWTGKITTPADISRYVQTLTVEMAQF